MAVNLIQPIIIAIIVLAGSLFSASAIKAQQKIRTNLELVLAVDTSTSVDAIEFELQRQGIAAAFLHPHVLNAIRSIGADGIAVAVLHWAGTGRQNIAVDWTLVKDVSSAAILADKISRAPRVTSGMTDIGGAIIASVNALQSNLYLGDRQTIDVSGDGTGDQAGSLAARNFAVSLGVTINGLVIHNEDIDLGELAKQFVHEHYENYVIGGEGAFLMSAADFDGFAVSMRRKLVREILGPKFAQADLRPKFPPRFCRVLEFDLMVLRSQFVH